MSRNRRKFRGANNPKAKINKLFGPDLEKPCAHCGMLLTQKTATLDHIIPVSLKGPRNRIDNLQISCKVCNCYKSDLIGDAWEKIKPFAWYYRILKSLKKSDRIYRLRQDNETLEMKLWR